VKLEAAFLQDIKDHPDDDTPRLIFADWLEEHGQPERAALIRVQVERARLPEADPRQRQLAAEEQQLLREHGDAWLGPLRLLADRWEFRRGLLHLDVNTWRFRDPRVTESHADEFLWVERLHLRGLDSRSVARFTEPSFLAHFRQLDLSEGLIFKEGALVLAHSPALAGLSLLGLGGNAIEDAGLAVLAASPHLAGLRVLQLWGNRLGDVAAHTLARSPHLNRLTTLDLMGNHLGASGAAALAAAPPCARLTALDLTYNGLGPRGASALADSPFMANLTALGLRGNQIRGAGATSLASSPYLRNLRLLDVRANHIDPGGAARLRERFGAAVRMD
jgi:uncharacterized protein (TIGR02996 family)